MKLENQVTSHEISKRLKELGVKQESLFYWEPQSNGIFEITRWYHKDSISAFTVAELGEMLPLGTASLHIDTWYDSLPVQANKNWMCRMPERPAQRGLKRHIAYALTEADARGRCLIYLLENGLLKL